ncbi:hypothetical protein DRH14_02780, partial [Candidatus Shapirobacteria bacterium]
KKAVYYLLSPITVLIIFLLYYYQTGDFWAYFHSGDNIHLNPFPFMVFFSHRSWIHSIWLEDIIYIYFIASLAVSRLFKKYKISVISVYPAIFLLSTFFVAHRDISRYLSPAYPFFVLAFAKPINQLSFKKVFLIILPAIFLYALNFCLGNTAPVADWTPYL